MKINLVDAANRLAAKLAGQPWFSAAGITEDDSAGVALIVYLKRNLRCNELDVPSDWEGISVRTQHLGRVRPAERSLLL